MSLSGLGGSSVSVKYATANGTAKAGGDYIANNGTLTFNTNETNKIVGIRVQGDTAKEDQETFFVNLGAPMGATLIDNQGKGTITNDDYNL